jgi:hypothetical protein
VDGGGGEKGESAEEGEGAEDAEEGVGVLDRQPTKGSARSR